MIFIFLDNTMADNYNISPKVIGLNEEKIHNNQSIDMICSAVYIELNKDKNASDNNYTNTKNYINKLDVDLKIEVLNAITERAKKGYEHWKCIADNAAADLMKYKVVIPLFDPKRNNSVFTCKYYINDILCQMDYCLERMDICMNNYKLFIEMI